MSHLEQWPRRRAEEEEADGGGEGGAMIIILIMTLDTRTKACGLRAAVQMHLGIASRVISWRPSLPFHIIGSTDEPAPA